MYVFISAYKTENEAFENQRRNQHLLSRLNSLGVKSEAVIGKYCGVVEHSFKVRAEEVHHIKKILVLAESFEQESILTMFEDGTNCRLISPNGKELARLGNYTKVTEAVAVRNKNYTLERLNDYYICQE